MILIYRQGQLEGHGQSKGEGKGIGKLDKQSRVKRKKDPFSLLEASKDASRSEQRRGAKVFCGHAGVAPGTHVGRHKQH